MDAIGEKNKCEKNERGCCGRVSHSLWSGFWPGQKVGSNCPKSCSLLHYRTAIILAEILSENTVVSVSVTTQMGRYLGSPEPVNDLGVTTMSHLANLTQERFIGREIPRRVAALQRWGAAENWAEHEIYMAFLVCRARGHFPGWPGIGGFMWFDLGARSGIGGIFCRVGPGLWHNLELGMVVTTFRKQLLGLLGKFGRVARPLELLRWRPGHLHALRVYNVYEVILELAWIAISLYLRLLEDMVEIFGK